MFTAANDYESVQKSIKNRLTIKYFEMYLSNFHFWCFFLSPMKTAAMDYLSKFFSIKTKRSFYISSSMKSEYLIKLAFFHWCSIRSFHWEKNFRVCEWHTSFQFVHVLFVYNLVSSSVKLRRKKNHLNFSFCPCLLAFYVLSSCTNKHTHTPIHTHNETNYRRIFLWMKKNLST